jgi:hypothetical protein
MACVHVDASPRPYAFCACSLNSPLTNRSPPLPPPPSQFPLTLLFTGQAREHQDCPGGSAQACQGQQRRPAGPVRPLQRVRRRRRAHLREGLQGESMRKVFFCVGWWGWGWGWGFMRFSGGRISGCACRLGNGQSWCSSGTRNTAH